MCRIDRIGDVRPQPISQALQQFLLFAEANIVSSERGNIPFSNQALEAIRSGFCCGVKCREQIFSLAAYMSCMVCFEGQLLH